MALRANQDHKYFRRFLMLAGLCAAFAGWCFYDALVKYPAEMERAEVYWKPDGQKFKGMERTHWLETTARNNWPTKPPRKPDKLKHGIQSQYLYAGICGVILIPCLLKWFLAKGTWVEGTETEITTSWGSGFKYSDVTSIDKTKWEKKGITRIHHTADGKEQTFVFDDFKFDRETMGKILTTIESGLKDEQITGGDRETEINARRKKLEQEKQAARDAT